MTEETAAGALVAIVEDDAAIAEGLALNLKLLGYRSEAIGDGETRRRADRGEPARSRAARHHACPCRAACGCSNSSAGGRTRCRSSCSRPARTSSTRWRRSGSGADDYITKPFALAELLARVAAVLRRARLSDPARVRAAR